MHTNSYMEVVHCVKGSFFFGIIKREFHYHEVFVIIDNIIPIAAMMVLSADSWLAGLFKFSLIK